MEDEPLTLSPELYSPYEVAARELDQLIAWARENDNQGKRNEATTRLQLINRLLEDCLAWPSGKITAEDAYEGTYVDYLLATNGTRLVVEAKREGVSFELPPEFSSRTVGARALRDFAGAVWPAVDQALNYCLKRGIPLGVVSNGHQMIGFIGSRQDGVPPAEGRFIVFSSLEDMRAEFDEFWRCFSVPGVESQHLYARLQRRSQPPPPQKLSSSIFRYPGTKNRNEIQTELQILGELFLQDVVEAPALEQSFLEEAYCPSGALSQYAMVSREILQTRYNAFFADLDDVSEQPAMTKKGLAPELTTDVLAASLSNRPIILLGDVGVGKTTFIRRLIRVEAREIFEQAIALYVDLGSQPTLATEIEPFIQQAFITELLEQYEVDIYERNFVRGVYHANLQRFSRGIYSEIRDTDPGEYQRRELETLERATSDTEAHLRASLEHITSAQKRQIVIFLDNVDQRPLQFQEQVFLIAQGLATRWPGTVFVSLRPETFYRSRARGSLAAYQPRVFTISPPRIDLVLRRRLEFAQKRLKATGTLEALGPSVSFKSQALEAYVHALLYSLSANEDLIELIDNLSAGNVRRALSFVTAFVGSGHVDSAKIVRIVQETGRYTVPVHEFLNAVIYGDHEHYDPASSGIANAFDISLPDAREHFLVLLLLAFIERAGESAGSEGFVSVPEIFTEGQRLGFLPSQIESAIARCQGKTLIEANLRGVMFGEADRYRITPAGAYMLKRLITLFTYVDAMIVDTPIIDEATRRLISNVRPIGERLARAENFRRYLDAGWKPLAELAPSFDWNDISRDLAADIERIALKLSD